MRAFSTLLRRGRAGEWHFRALLRGGPYDIHSYVDVAPLLFHRKPRALREFPVRKAEPVSHFVYVTIS